MRDAVAVHEAGVTVVLIVHTVFERAACSQLQTLGVPDIAVISYNQPKPRDTAAEECQQAREVAIQIPDKLHCK